MNQKVRKSPTDAITAQKNVFSKWIQFLLSQNGIEVEINAGSLIEQLKSGEILLKLVEVLIKVPSNIKFFKTDNKLQVVGYLSQILEYITKQGGLKLTVSADNIYDGNEMMVLGLIWILILKYQVGIKANLQDWVEKILSQKITNFDAQWKDGKLYAMLVNTLVEIITPSPSPPSSISLFLAASERDVSRQYSQSELLEYAFTTAEDVLGIQKMISVNDILSGYFDERSNLTYLSFFYNKYRNFDKLSNDQLSNAMMMDHNNSESSIDDDSHIQSTNNDLHAKIITLQSDLQHKTDENDELQILCNSLQDTINHLQLKLSSSSSLESQITEKSIVISDQSSLIAELRSQLEEKDRLLHAMSLTSTEKDKVISDQQVIIDDERRRFEALRIKSENELQHLMNTTKKISSQLSQFRDRNSSLQRKLNELIARQQLDNDVFSNSIPPFGGNEVVLVNMELENAEILWAQSPKEMSIAVAALKTYCREFISQRLTAKGYEVRSIGDSYQYAFESVHSAIQFALSVQTFLWKRDWPINNKKLYSGLLFSIGISRGFSLFNNGSYDGPNSVVVRRFASSARPGEIILPTQLLNEYVNNINNNNINNNNNNNNNDGGGNNDTNEEIWHRPIGEYEVKEVRGKYHLSQLFPRKLKGRAKKITISSFELLSAEEKFKIQLLEKLNHLKADNRDLKKQLKKLKFLADEAQSKANELNLQFQAMKNDLDDRNAEIDLLHLKIVDLLNEINELYENYNAVNRKLKAAKSLLGNMDQHIRSLCKQHSELSAEFDTLQRSSTLEIAQLRKQIQSLSKKRRSFITRLISKSPDPSHLGGYDDHDGDHEDNDDHHAVSSNQPVIPHS